MNGSDSELDTWLAGSDIFEQYPLVEVDDWAANFDADRQLVVLKFGPFKRLFLRPDKFTKRFYHQLYPLKIETWSYRRQITVFDEFCTLDISLELRFQATLKYAQKNAEVVASINQHIKHLYADVVEDVVNQTLQALADGSWLQQGLAEHEKRIAIGVCELLMQQNIQSQAICNMTASFAEFPDVQLGRDSVYVNVLKKTFEFTQEKNKELYRQQRLAEQQELMEKQRQLEHLRQLAEMQRQIQAHEAEVRLQLLKDQEHQIARQRELETRLHAEQIRHEQQLKEIGFELELQAQQQMSIKQRMMEAQQVADQLAHQAFIDDKKTQAEIQRREAMQNRWREANQHPHENGGDSVVG